MSWNLTRWQVRTIAGAAVVLVGVGVYWAARPEADAPRAALPAAAVEGGTTLAAAGTPRVQHVAPPQAQPVPVAASTQLVAIEDTELATVADYTAQKYQFLFDDLRYLPAERVDELRRALLDRELLDGAIKAARESGDAAAAKGVAAQQAALEKAERQIRSLLNPGDYATYELLKDSDLEQMKLGEYAGGVSNVAPLSAADRRAILKTKLAYKARFEQLLADSGLKRSNLSPTEREYAYSVTARALEDYKRSYLQEVRQYLSNEEQYVLLSNYENTEFTAELAKLRPADEQ
jgi:hypothetical protein